MKRKLSEWLQIVKNYYKQNIGIEKLANKIKCDYCLYFRIRITVDDIDGFKDTYTLK